MDSAAKKISRRELLKLGVTTYGGFVVGSGFLCASDASWALETTVLSGDVMATLAFMARDIYPHERFGDDLYVTAVKGYDARAANDPDFRVLMEEGVAYLNSEAVVKGYDNYLSMDDSVERLAVLEAMSGDDFFQAVRGDLVVSLYNQKAVWAILGYEGAVFDKGGYLHLGFDDINWL